MHTRHFTIGTTLITESSPPYVIAEIGNNTFIQNDPDHTHSVELCKTLITRAKAAGASAVKLQKRDPASLYASSLFNKPYNGRNSFGPTYGTHREALEFNLDQWETLINHAKTVGITLFSTAFDLKSVVFLSNLDMPVFKVASGCLRDIPLIKQLALLDKPLILSTGGAEWEDVDAVNSLLTDMGTPFCFLHCTMQYPCEASNVNLRIISAMRLRYSSTIIGFSDHTVGTWAIPAAYQYGAMIFEKHFTSNKSLPGPDHTLSIEPDELQSLTHTLSRIHAARGSGDKHMLECERDNYWKMGKGVYSARKLARGMEIEMDDLCIKSPAEGLLPEEIYNIAGRKRPVRDIDADTPITPNDIA